MHPARRSPITSASIVVALLALVVAMSGSAVAASLITSKQIKDGTIQTKDLSKKAIASIRAKAAAGSQGPQGPAGPPGPRGATGAAGKPGAPGTARAYTLVNDLGVMSSPKSKNVVSVIHAGPGNYCVKLAPSIDATTVEAVVTPDSSTSPEAITAYVRSNDSGCPSVSNVISVSTVRIYTLGAGSNDVESPTDAGFFMMVP